MSDHGFPHHRKAIATVTFVEIGTTNNPKGCNWSSHLESNAFANSTIHVERTPAKITRLNFIDSLELE